MLLENNLKSLLGVLLSSLRELFVFLLLLTMASVTASRWLRLFFIFEERWGSLMVAVSVENCYYLCLYTCI